MAAKNFIGTNYVPGIRNNNPGNIRPGDNWIGMQGVANNFVVFKNMDYGFRALAIDISSKIKKGFNTVRKIIERYAPPMENNTEAYINAVEHSTGFGENAVLKADEPTVKKLMYAISRHEIGDKLWDQLLSQSDINSGYALVPITTAAVQATKDFFVNNPVVNTAASNGVIFVVIIVVIIIIAALYSKYGKSTKP